ncbi:uncharacterized protein K460DRAFT_351207 [Cucurbitaria berberidis CBS 394.84]|uniref:Uncharacterized protein n=1 Tax=Cucurbitaria berberidis CBS 394.84 TaxID=1168544 RepID=A0A9P4LDX3_9PLEO|nr:uncharacterized protein K460DRAFT_351207 [Cucurbitaria berberidis CBS 394.84]KAF1851258.1 hypothetical protein K460DRAFT_351207 [Cucurbitaria berberidis CBS 394.84]
MAEEFGGAEEVETALKRTLTREPDMGHIAVIKEAELEHATNVYRLTAKQSGSFIASLTVENKADDLSNQPSLASGDTVWGEKGREMEGSEIPRYVNHQATMEPYGIALPSDAVSEWTDFPTTTSVHNFNPDYIGFVRDSGQPEEAYPLSSPHGDLRADFAYPSDYAGHEIWTENQKRGPMNTNPD